MCLLLALFCACPDLVNESVSGRGFLLFPIGFPRTDFQKSEHVHAVDIVEPPTGIKERVVCGIDVVVQRQFPGFVSVVASAAFVGKSLSTSVVCV